MQESGENEIRRLDINQSMTKPMMVMGCDRRLLLSSSLGCVYVGFNLGIARGQFDVLILAIVCWFVIRFSLRLMGKADPMMLDVFQRSMSYTDKPMIMQFYYPAVSNITVKTPAHVKKRWL